MSDFSVKIEPSEVVSLQNDTYVSLLKAIGKMYESMPLTELRGTHIADNKYRYKFVTADGRTWIQDLWVLEDLVHNFHCNFDKVQGDDWSEQEFGSHRDVRRGFVKLFRLGVTKIIVTWT